MKKTKNKKSVRIDEKQFKKIVRALYESDGVIDELTNSQCYLPSIDKARDVLRELNKVFKIK